MVHGVAGAACFAVHITGLSQWATPANAYALTAWSVTAAALLCAAAAAVTSGPDAPPTPSAWGSLVYLALVATCLGFVVQAWAQSALSATTAAVVMTMEPVFAALIATALGGVAKMIRSSHERWDGRGYPDALAGDEIPLGAQIVFVCDAFSAMTSERPYAPARTEIDALAELRRHAGAQFAPAVVDAFLRAVTQEQVAAGLVQR